MRPPIVVPDYIQRLVPYVPGKPIEETQREYGIKKVVKLASNENPLGPSPKAVRAMRAALPELHRYPDGSGYRLKAALANHLSVEPEMLILGNGSNEVIDFLIRTFCVAGDSLVTSKAAFIAYKICAQIHGVRTLESDLTADLRFDLPAIARRVREDSRAKLVFIANPNNPTGTYVTEAELTEFLVEMERVSAARSSPVLVALDYAYWEYVTARDLPDPMKLMKRFPFVVVLRTFSKIYGLAGIRAGYGIALPEIIGTLEKVRQPFNLNSLALVGAENALEDTAFVARARKMNLTGMRFWEKELSKLRIPFWKSQGNFLLADVQKGLGRPGGEIYQNCLKNGVIFRPVSNYGLLHALRISVGTMEENRFAARVLAEVARG